MSLLLCLLPFSSFRDHLSRNRKSKNRTYFLFTYLPEWQTKAHQASMCRQNKNSLIVSGRDLRSRIASVWICYRTSNQWQWSRLLGCDVICFNVTTHTDCNRPSKLVLDIYVSLHFSLSSYTYIYVCVHYIYSVYTIYIYIYIYIYSFIHSYDRSKASSKVSSPHTAIQSFLFQMRVSFPSLKVIQ